MNWGRSWRTPTDAEWTELINNCTSTWTSQNGVNGRLVTGPMETVSSFPLQATGMARTLSMRGLTAITGLRHSVWPPRTKPAASTSIPAMSKGSSAIAPTGSRSVPSQNKGSLRPSPTRQPDAHASCISPSRRPISFPQVWVQSPQGVYSITM